MDMHKLFLTISLLISMAYGQTPQQFLLMKKTVSFVPTDLSGLKLWLKADQLSLSDNDPVSTWADQSGNSNDVTASLTVRPTYKANIQNGKAVVRFDGSNDVMNKSSFTALDGLTGITIFLVVKQATLATNQVFLSKWDYQTQGTFAWQTGSSSSSEEVSYWAPTCNAAGNENVVSSSAGITAAFNLLELVYDGSLTNSNRVKYYKNTSALSTSTNNTIPTSTITCTADLRIGSFGGSLTRYFNGDFAEILIYNSALSGADRAKVEAYLNARWAIY